ncbi:small ribosomal subunit Rsm22 family protein [Methylocystis heyeri]|uniref:Methyltransferase domain-containing protein n=1 Tax=Methylocystis heyeri TaxID=391905 RepID=A0A6B8KJX5_9HYPH|nr:small ribosomal subunit Rsm22 family protein [Methylocystis heyeri]QGM47391.1 methyltransferase domain-containing protein [Methylocystis heyeri]
MNQHGASTARAALPAELSAAIAQLLEGRARKELAERAARISAGFRARKTSRELLREDDDALAYALTRLPATFAVNAAVMRRILEEAPDFSPRSLLDAGCGLASAALAALESWPAMETIRLLDRSPEFLALAARLKASSRHAALAEAALLTADLDDIPAGEGEADLVVASYALTEIPDRALEEVAEALWTRARGALVLVEPGTPRDHARLMGLRRRLIELGAKVGLPCPHDSACPMTEPDWCHFAARLPRSRDHMLAKGGEVPFEDEKYCYLVAFKPSQAESEKGARVLAPPRSSKWGVELGLCTARGLERKTFAKRDKGLFQIMRKAEWGDSVALKEGNDR